MLNVPSTAAFHHQSIVSSARVRITTVSPSGSERMSAANIGRSGGNILVVTQYVVPHAVGATAVAAINASKPVARGAALSGTRFSVCPLTTPVFATDISQSKIWLR